MVVVVSGGTNPLMRANTEAAITTKGGIHIHAATGSILRAAIRFMSRFNAPSTNTDPTISGIRALSAPRYSFSDARYFFLLILCIIVAAIKEYRFYSVVYDRKKTSHIFAVAGMTLAVVISATFLAVPDQHGRPYPDTPDIGNDPFAATFDAFMKKQSWLDLEVDPRLAEMSDPYDNNLRAELQVGFNWDYAFYKGHYYCYFGAAPVVTFYYPYYKLTGFIPTLATANNFFTALASLFVCAAILAFVRAMKLKANLFRTESRGMHYREDYPYHDDENWLCHVGVYKDENGEVQCKKIEVPDSWKGDLSEPHEKRYVLLFPGEAEALGIPEEKIYQPKTGRGGKK